MTNDGIDEHDDEHDLGFAHDRRLLVSPRTVSRRAALGMITAGATGVAALLAMPVGSAAAATPKTPQETAGPYPADGSNGPDVLDDQGIVRRDIRSSFGAASGTADGVNLRIALNIVHADTSEPYPKAAVYLWHCDRVGRYSLYSQDIAAENYLRGIQVANAAGAVQYRSIFPGCYSGRWPHIHFEVYPSLANAHAARNRLLTSQIAIPSAAANAVYATSGYSSSAANFSGMNINNDMVFSDGYSLELPTMTGSIGHTYTATLTVAV